MTPKREASEAAKSHMPPGHRHQPARTDQPPAEAAAAGPPTTGQPAADPPSASQPPADPTAAGLRPADNWQRTGPRWASPLRTQRQQASRQQARAAGRPPGRPALHGPTGSRPADNGLADHGPALGGPAPHGPGGSRPADDGPAGSGPALNGPAPRGPAGSRPPTDGPAPGGLAGSRPAGDGPAGSGRALGGPAPPAGPADSRPAGNYPADSGPADSRATRNGPAHRAADTTVTHRWPTSPASSPRSPSTSKPAPALPQPLPSQRAVAARPAGDASAMSSDGMGPQQPEPPPYHFGAVCEFGAGLGLGKDGAMAIRWGCVAGRIGRRTALPGGAASKSTAAGAQGTASPGGAASGDITDIGKAGRGARPLEWLGQELEAARPTVGLRTVATTALAALGRNPRTFTAGAWRRPSWRSTAFAGTSTRCSGCCGTRTWLRLS